MSASVAGNANGRAFATRLAWPALLAGVVFGCARTSDHERDVVTAQGAVTAGDTISSAKLQLQTLTNLCGATETQDYFQVTNKGTSPITVSDISIKLWIDDTSGQTVVPHVWTGGCLTNATGCYHQVSGVSATAKPLPAACGPDAAHQANWEITITSTDKTALAPNDVWTNLQSAFNLANYAHFAPGSGSWYSPCLGGHAYADDGHFAVYVKGNLVLSPSSGITTPVCRSPKGQQTVPGHLTADQLGATCSGVVAPSTILQLAVGLPVSDSQALADKVVAVSDPNSPSFAQYLSADDFVAQFSPPVSSQQAVLDWAAANGLTVTGTYPNRLLVDVSGTADQVERALFTNLVLCTRPDGSQFHAPDRQPSLNVPAPLLHVGGLDNFVVAQPLAGVGTGPHKEHASADFRGAYASCSTLDGAGQSVGIIAFAGFDASDITSYACRSHLVTCDSSDQILSGTIPTVTTKTIGKVTQGGFRDETTADIEMAIAMAPALSSVVVYEIQGGDDLALVNDALNSVLSDGVVNQAATSWFLTGDASTQTILRAWAVQGRSFFISSGDRGASSWTTDPGEIMGPAAADPKSGYASFQDMDGVTVVGGTRLDYSGPPLVIWSESTWNAAGEGASGGGIAKYASAPLYQTDFSFAVGGAGKRVLPDVSMVASNVYTFIGGKEGASFGTSLSAPLWAAYVALANQQRQQLGLTSVGFINPFVYDIGRAAPGIYNASFSDIADGSDNRGSCPSGVSPSPCPNGGWKPSSDNALAADVGYDLSTGLGSPRCFLLQELGTKTITFPPTPDAGAGADAGGSADANVSTGAGGSAGSDGGAGSGGSGGSSGSGGAGGAQPPSIAVVATEASHGVEFCMQGGGFTPGHLIQFRYLNLPGNQVGHDSGQGPLIVDANGRFTNFDPTFGGGASSLSGFIQNCSPADLDLTMTIQVTQLDDPSLAAAATISNRWICGAEPLQNSDDETPLPFPPMFGQTTCPLPPD
jgi:xanthomonalisin